MTSVQGLNVPQSLLVSKLGSGHMVEALHLQLLLLCLEAVGDITKAKLRSCRSFGVACLVRNNKLALY